MRLLDCLCTNKDVPAIRVGTSNQDRDSISKSVLVITKCAMENQMMLFELLEVARDTLDGHSGRKHLFNQLKKPIDFWLHFENCTGIRLAR